jgi:hypothetical protein
MTSDIQLSAATLDILKEINISEIVVEPARELSTRSKLMLVKAYFHKNTTPYDLYMWLSCIGYIIVTAIYRLPLSEDFYHIGAPLLIFIHHCANLEWTDTSKTNLYELLFAILGTICVCSICNNAEVPFIATLIILKHYKYETPVVHKKELWRQITFAMARQVAMFYMIAWRDSAMFSVGLVIIYI